MFATLEDTEEELIMKEIVAVKPAVRFMDLERITTTFVPNWGRKDRRFAVIYQHRDNTPESKTKYEFVKVLDDYTLELGVSKALGDLSETQIANIDPNSVLQLLPGLEVTGIVPQYSTADFDAKGGRWGHGLILIFKWDRSLRYCYTFTRELNPVVSSFCTRRQSRRDFQTICVSVQ